MAQIKLTARAFAHLEQVFEHLAVTDPNRALSIVQKLREGVNILAEHPLIGRAVEDGRRELVLSRGRTAHVVLYRWIPADDLVLVLAVRDAKQAGYPAD